MCEDEGSCSWSGKLDGAQTPMLDLGMNVSYQGGQALSKLTC